MSDSQSQQSPYPQPQSYVPPPPKKKHTLRNVLLVVGVLSILLIGGCLALVAGAVNEMDKAITEEQKNDEPVAVGEGEPFTHDDFQVEGDWRVAREFGGVTIKGLRVRNNLDEARSALFTFRFYAGNENLAEVECTSNQMQPDEVSRMDCISFDSGFPKGYTEIRVSDMW